MTNEWVKGDWSQQPSGGMFDFMDMSKYIVKSHRKRTSRRRLKKRGKFLTGGYIMNSEKLFIGSITYDDYKKFCLKLPTMPENINNMFHVETVHGDKALAVKWIKEKIMDKLQ